MEYLKYFLRFTEDVNTNRYNLAKEEDIFEYQPAISFEEIEKLKAQVSAESKMADAHVRENKSVKVQPKGASS